MPRTDEGVDRAFAVGLETSTLTGSVRRRVVESALSLLEDVATYILAGALGVCAFLITYDVVGRRYFSSGAPWVVELSEYLLVYLTFLAAPWILRHNGHVCEEFAIQRLSPGARQIVNIATGVVSLVICLAMGAFAYQTTVDLYRRDVVLAAILRVPKWVVLAPLAAGFFLLSLEMLRKLTSLTVEKSDRRA